MSVYHIENGGLVKIAETINDWVPSDGSQAVAWHRVGFEEVEENEGAFTWYEASELVDDAPQLDAYLFAFAVEAGSDLSRWVVLVRDSLPEFLLVMKMLEPLLTRANYLQVEAEIQRRMGEQAPQRKYLTPG
ncbi:hypothetical protein [Salinicola sp. CPA57]|uniref:hypothetical protein n=1 Tax=Salinicola sp. CPA57 TaxID=1949080 RepID=UPI000DA2385A|nr:hypothetical protein [Salinicola sp. CPA57]